MTHEEYLADIETRRNALSLRLSVIMASALPPRVKAARINLVTKDIIALKNEIRAASKTAVD